MNGDPGKKIVMLLSFCVALVVFGWTFLRDSDLLSAAYNALAVLFVSALILLQVMKAIGAIMIHYLQSQNEQARLEEEQHNETKE